MPATLSKRDSNTGDFLLILQNFQEQLICKTSANRLFFDSVNTFDVIRQPYPCRIKDMVEPYLKNILIKHVLFLF